MEAAREMASPGVAGFKGGRLIEWVFPVVRCSSKLEDREMVKMRWVVSLPVDVQGIKYLVWEFHTAGKWRVYFVGNDYPHIPELDTLPNPV